MSLFFFCLFGVLRRINNIFSSPEHNMLRVSYCDRSLSGVHSSVRPWTIT